MSDHQLTGSTALVVENNALRAQLAAETARLEWCLGVLVSTASWGEETWLVTDMDLISADEKIPEGQTARDVIDRLIKEKANE